MAVIELRKMITVFDISEEDTTYRTTWVGKIQGTTDMVSGTEEYDSVDGFVEAFYASPTNADRELDGVSHP